MSQSTRPPFSQLPLQKSGPKGNAWGLFGADDQLGMLNFLTPEVIKQASTEIQYGIRVSTDLLLDKIKMPGFGRRPFHQEIQHRLPRLVNDDVLTFNTQSSSQWDGFRHYGYQAEQLYFNGRTHEQMFTSNLNGIHHWAESGGIVGRGVLLDWSAWAQKQPDRAIVDSFSTHSIPLNELLEVAKHQGVSFKQGDVLFVRTGYLSALEALSPEEMKTLAETAAPPAIGVESSEETLRWLWEEGFTAVVGDNPSFEAWPCQNKDFWLHEWLLAGWGMPIGELFDLEQLSKECASRKKWTFFFSSVPLKVSTVHWSQD
jgi:hypothetical protein